jgi:cytochrome c
MTRPPLLIAAGAAVLLAGCGSSPRALPGASADRGHADIVQIGCGACHQISGVDGADGRVGPSLVDFSARHYIAGGRLTNTPSNAVRWIMSPQQILPGGVMPDLGVDSAAAADIVAYLYGQ